MGLARVVCFLSRLERTLLIHRISAKSRRSTVIRIVGLFCLVVLLLLGLTLLVRVRRGWRQDYVVVGTDDHTSVLHLLSSEISMRRIEVLPPCQTCDSGPATGLTKPLVAVFVLIDTVKRLRRIDEALGNNNWRSFIECRAAYDYTVFVLHGKMSSADAPGTPDDNAWIERLLASSLEECRTKRGKSVVTWLASVSSERNFVGAVNDILIEAYFDNVTWFDIFFWSDGQPESGFRKWETDPATLLEDVQNIGAVADQETLRGRRDVGHVFLHKSHYEIFGNFFNPTPNWVLAASIDYLLRIYSSNDLLRSQPRPNRGDRSTVKSKQLDDTVNRSTAVYFFDVESTLGLHYDNRVHGDKTNQQNQWTELLALDTHVLSRYTTALKKASNRCLRCDLLNRSSSVGRHRVVAMSLYGDDPRYTLGAVRNAHLLPVIFPGWKLWIYCDRPPPPPLREADTRAEDVACASVPAQVTHRLKDLGAEIRYAPRLDGVAPMLWRFLPVDDVTVDVFVSRDCDSRLSERDAAAVSAWLDSDAMLHCMRDHPSHAGYPLSGGLWGARTGWLRLTLGGGGAGGGGRPLAALAKGYGGAYLDDMNFLGRDVWPAVQADIYCHDSVSCDRWPRSHPFPVERLAFEHVGQVFDAYSRPRQGDVDIIMAAPRNPVCEPEQRQRTSPVPS